MISRFFIDRPIFAAVLSIVITLAGAISISTLALSQFPPISPPSVTVMCTYPGASAQDVAQAVAAPIEQQVNGVEGMMYMSSQCTNTGNYTLTVTFQHGIDLDMAQVLVQNRVNLALPQLPDVIKQTGVTTRKQSPDILGGFAIYATNPRIGQLYLSNYALMQIRDELLRVPGVSDVLLFGERDYSMRIWLDPQKMAVRNLTAADVVNAIREQNNQVAAGQIGQPPVHKGQALQITLTTLGRLQDVAQFEDIVLRTTPDGSLLRIKDVGRVELGAKDENVSVEMDGKDTVFLAIWQLPDANALATKEKVAAKMEELKKNFPDGVTYDMAFDTTPYTRESIKEVFHTLLDAIILVAVVVLLFLQNWRSALIPMVAVPVAIVGTFAVMAAIGFSLNNLTLFGLVLAIGIVVDDAIVVVEAVEHHIDNGLAPREATIKAMEQVSGPVVAVGLVLSAVFLPCAFISGITGQFFRQFALTIASSTLISAFNSLTLSPALAALLLRPRDKHNEPPLPRLAFALAGGWLGWEFLTGPLADGLGDLAGSLTGDAGASLHNALPWLAPLMAVLAGGVVGWALSRPLNHLLGAFFRLFNKGFVRTTHGYARGVGWLLRGAALVLVVYGVLVGATWVLHDETPKGFIPSQDMGYLLINVQLPDSASLERTQKVMRQIMAITRATPGVKHVSAITGQSFVLNAYGSNFGSMFVNLKDYDLRRDPSLHSDVIANNLRAAFAEKIYDAQVAVFGPPPVRGVGRAGGFAIMIEDHGDLGPAALQEQVEKLVRLGNQPDPKETPYLLGPDGKPQLLGLFSVFRANVPQILVTPDPAQCMLRGVSLLDYQNALAVYLGSLYVNDFNRFDRTWQVNVQADAAFRQRLEDLDLIMIRNRRGGMVPLGSVAEAREINGPLVLTRYNMYPAASINGTAAPGVSSGDAIARMQRLAEEELPRNMNYEWTDMSYLELLAGNTAMVLFGFAVVMVFLVLAAQYESWSLPLAVILVVPMCLLGAIAGVALAHMDINIFTRIGFVVLVGLASKNAILIVEFAKVQRHAGKSGREATLEACTLRLRPIVMTSLAFILGVVPLILATGAGADMRKALGVAVFSGMIGVTLFGIFLTPVFFYTIDWLGSTHLLSSPGVRLTGRIGINVLTLGIPFLLGSIASYRRDGRLWAPSPVKKPAVPEPAAGTSPAPDVDKILEAVKAAEANGPSGAPAPAARDERIKPAARNGEPALPHPPANGAADGTSRKPEASENGGPARPPAAGNGEPAPSPTSNGDTRPEAAGGDAVKQK